MTPDPADSLYETVPPEFVKARNALAKSLKVQGQRAEADRISRMSRPSPSVWASNQIARHAADLVARLADVTARLQGGIQRDRARYAAAINEHRDLLNRLRERAEEVLGEGGFRVAPPVIAAAVQNFRAGLADGALRPVLERGRLEHDVGLEAGGLLGMSVSDLASEPAPVARTPAPSPPPPGGQAASDLQAERDRREQARLLAKARAEAEHHVHALRKSAEAAAATRAKQESQVEEARRRLESAEHALAAARAAEQQATAALATGESDLQKLADRPA